MRGQPVGADWRELLDAALNFEGTVDLVGVGSPVRGDDGVGLAVASKLRSRLGRSPRGMKIHPETTMPERLLSKLASTADRVILVDAVEASGPPGSIVFRRLGDSKYGYFATHNLPLKLVPGLERRLGEFYVLGIRPDSLEVADGLSNAAVEAVDTIVEFFVDREADRR